MKKLPLVCTVLVLLSCVEKDQILKVTGFWVSIDYKINRPFQTLTIWDSLTLSNPYGTLYLIEANQYGGYPELSPMDTSDGQLTAFGPHWDNDFIIGLEGDTLVQVFSLGKPDERKNKYVRMDSLSVWRQSIFNDLLLQIDLPEAKENDFMIPKRKSIVTNLFLGPIKESVRIEYTLIAQDSTALQIYDVLIRSNELERFLRGELAKHDEVDRDSIIVVLNADVRTSDVEISEWVGRVKRLSPTLRVWRSCIDLERRKFRYRSLTANSKDNN